MRVPSNYDWIDDSDDDDRLLAMLREVLARIVEDVELVARVVKRLEARGIDVSFIGPELHTLRRIGDGQILPALYQKYIGKPLLFHYVAGLPLKEQQRVTDDEPFTVYLPDGDHHMRRPSEMSRQQIHQVFTNGHIRSQVEQLNYLEEKQSKRPARIPRDENACSIDRKRGLLLVDGPCEIPLADLLRYASEMSARR